MKRIVVHCCVALTIIASCVLTISSSSRPITLQIAAQGEASPTQKSIEYNGSYRTYLETCFKSGKAFGGDVTSPALQCVFKHEDEFYALCHLAEWKYSRGHFSLLDTLMKCRSIEHVFGAIDAVEQSGNGHESFLRMREEVYATVRSAVEHCAVVDFMSSKSPTASLAIRNFLSDDFGKQPYWIDCFRGRELLGDQSNIDNVLGLVLRGSPTGETLFTTVVQRLCVIREKLYAEAKKTYCDDVFFELVQCAAMYDRVGALAALCDLDVYTRYSVELYSSDVGYRVLTNVLQGYGARLDNKDESHSMIQFLKKLQQQYNIFPNDERWREIITTSMSGKEESHPNFCRVLKAEFLTPIPSQPTQQRASASACAPSTPNKQQLHENGSWRRWSMYAVCGLVGIACLKLLHANYLEADIPIQEQV